MNRISRAISFVCFPAAVAFIGVSPAMAQQVTSLDTSILVPALGSPQTPQDIGIAKSVESKAVVDPASVRLLGEDDNAKYSVAEAEAGSQICIIVQLRSADGVSGSSCTTKEQFALSGVRVGVQENGGHAVVTYLLPADVDPTPVKTGSRALSGRYVANLVVQPGNLASMEPVELTRLNSGVKYSFSPLPWL